MEPFRFFHFHQHFPDIFFQSSSLTISLLYTWMEWAVILSYHWEGAFLPLDWSPHFVFPYGKMLSWNLDISISMKSTEVWYCKLGAIGAEYLPIMLSGLAIWLVLTNESLGERKWVTFGRSFKSPCEALFSFCLGDWQHPYWLLQ